MEPLNGLPKYEAALLTPEYRTISRYGVQVRDDSAIERSDRGTGRFEHSDDARPTVYGYGGDYEESEDS